MGSLRFTLEHDKLTLHANLLKVVPSHCLIFDPQENLEMAVQQSQSKKKGPQNYLKTTPIASRLKTCTSTRFEFKGVFHIA